MDEGLWSDIDVELALPEGGFTQAEDVPFLSADKLGNLTDQEALALSLKFEAGFSVKDIASVFKVTPSYVRRIVKKALEKYKVCVETPTDETIVQGYLELARMICSDGS